MLMCCWTTFRLVFSITLAIAYIPSLSKRGERTSEGDLLPFAMSILDKSGKISDPKARMLNFAFGKYDVRREQSLNHRSVGKEAIERCSQDDGIGAGGYSLEIRNVVLPLLVPVDLAPDICNAQTCTEFGSLTAASL
jgi:hypothetical protein